MSELTTDVLEHALAFHGQSAQLMNEIVEQVLHLQEGGKNKIYPPNNFPKIGGGQDNSGITLKIESCSEFENELLFPEAVAVNVLLAECGALTQAWGRGFMLSLELCKVLKLNEDQWSNEAIVGFSEFGETVGSATLVRWLIQSGAGKPIGITMQDHLKNLLYDKFADPVSKDDFELGVCTANAIVADIAQLAKENIPNMSSASENNPETIGLKVARRKHGARLAADLYLEARALAAKKLP